MSGNGQLQQISSSGSVIDLSSPVGVSNFNGLVIGSGGNTGTNLVGGAVDLSTGLYYFGGFTSNGKFKVYEYDPSANPRFRLKGTVVTTATSSSNGDIAFDAAGDLYMASGNGDITEIYSVTVATFQDANGGNSTSSRSAGILTMDSVNSVAFDASGKAYLGSGTQIRS